LEAISYDSEETNYSLEYDPLHQLTRVVDNSGDVWNYEYDEGNRLTGQSEKINSIVGTYTVSREYDAVSNLIGIKAGAETTTAYSYNQRDDLTSIDLPGGTVDEITFSYDKARKRTKAKTPGTISSVKYDEASRVTKFINETQSTTQTFTYDYDSNGNITTVSDNKTSGTVNDTRYAYDALNRLTDWYNPLTDTTTSYSYDKVGNLLEVKEGQTIIKSFTYNPANQISSADFSYDDNGNMTGDTDKRYVYDAENRLQQVVSKATSQTIASYEYDFMGRRTSSTDASGSTTYFHYDGWNVMAESDSSGTVTVNYYYDISGQIQAMKKAGRTYYYQFNAHGDVVSLTDSSGSVVNNYTYDPWGNHLTTSETVSNPFRYAGYRWDEDTGLYYLRARYYGPGIGRFLNKDKNIGDIKIPISQNNYLYCDDNPVSMIDVAGYEPQHVGVRRARDNAEGHMQEALLMDNQVFGFSRYWWARAMRFGINYSGLMTVQEGFEDISDDKKSISQKAWAGVKIGMIAGTWFLGPTTSVSGKLVGQQRTSRLIGFRNRYGPRFYTNKEGFFFAIDKAFHRLHLGPWDLLKL